MKYKNDAVLMETGMFLISALSVGGGNEINKAGVLKEAGVVQVKSEFTHHIFNKILIGLLHLQLSF